MSLATLLCVTVFAGCGREDITDGSETGSVTPSPVETQIPTETQDPEETQGPAETPAPTETPVPTPAPEVDRSAVFELFSHMTVGWNLGNTFDAHGAGNSMNAETYWGNPKTTREMIDAVSAQGINTLRIPVTWAEHVGAAPDYIIDEEWLSRVEEVVHYGLDNGMYVILDTHHEPDFWMSLVKEDIENTKAQLAAIWTQIAERFQDCDEHLLFEGMNEPRTKGTPGEWSGGTGPERKAVNELNGVFIDAVRAVGGNNETRCLIICPYGNSVTNDTLQTLKIYDDPNIAVAVHLYTPYFFTYDAPDGGYPEWDGSHKSEITSTLGKVDSFLLHKGVPVIVTEFGAVNKDNQEEIIKWLEDYMGTMNELGLKCIWWDNGLYTSTGENFGLLDRNALSWFSREVADALVRLAAGE